jgi:hypothetical protein
MMKPEPPNWREDQLSAFIAQAYENCHGRFVQLPTEYALLRSINDCFIKLRDNLNHSPDWFSAFFFLRCHSAYLGASRLAMSGQAPEAFMLLRGCIESALYGHYLSRHQELQEVWLRRHDSEDNMKRVKQEFRIATLFCDVDPRNAKLGKDLRGLYNRAVDYGGHPNERALSSTLEMKREPNQIRFDVSYLSVDGLLIRFSLVTCVLIGLRCLDLFGLVFFERFKILSLDADLDRVRHALKSIRA